MSSKIINRIEEIKENLELFDDDLDKYQYIIDLGIELEHISFDDEKEENLVKGCRSKVYLIPELREGNLYFKASSNSSITKGLIRIIRNIFNGLPINEILSVNIDILNKLNIQEIITPTRNNGLQNMFKKIQEYALKEKNNG